jgi:F-box-like
MWIASNRHVLPSAQEAVGIKEVINLLESELAAARELLEQTQARIADLEAKLAQEKASISPIRRLPFDILSEIFRICCIEERLAPVVIAAVCYKWRETIIDTPPAWSRIFPQNNFQHFLPNGYVSLFLERSIPCLLHLSAPWPRRACVCSSSDSKPEDRAKCDCVNVETMFEHTHRIQCLRVQLEWMGEYSTVPFENLTRLTIIRDGYASIKKTVSLLDSSLFPKLHYLDISHCLTVNSLINFSQPSGMRLRYLKICPDGGGYWLDLLELCTGTLTTLVVSGEFISSQKRVIELPVLESLIEMAPTFAEAPVLEVIAPCLVFYEIMPNTGSPGIVHDSKIHRVTHLITAGIPSLRDYPLLRTLHVPNSLNIVDGILIQLEEDVNICPGLQRIELFTTSDAFDKAWKAHPGDPPGRRLAKRNIKAGSDTKFVFNSKSPNTAPGYYHPVSPTFAHRLSLACLRGPKCTVDMPCRMEH